MQEGNKTKKCLCCGKKFLTYNNKRKYCSIKCFQSMPKTFSHMKLTKSKLYDLYFNKKLSFDKIENKTNISGSTITYWFKKWGFKARTRSEAQKGELNHMYKDGFHNNNYRAYIRDNKKCVVCGYNRIINIHHIDCNKQNNKLSNLITLCPNCHSLVHMNIIKINSINDWIDSNKVHKKFKD